MRDGAPPCLNSTRAVESGPKPCVGWVAAFTRWAGRASGIFSGRCCDYCRRCSGVVDEAESSPMVDVDLVRSEDQIDAGVYIGEDWLEGREVGFESEGLKQ